MLRVSVAFCEEQFELEAKIWDLRAGYNMNHAKT